MTVGEPAILDLELESAPESVALVRAGPKGLGGLLEVDDREIDPIAMGPPPAPIQLPGDVVATVSPVALLPGVLGRLVRALAAQARFSIERFSDVHLVVDLLVGHVQRFAEDERVCFALGAELRRLRLMIGPLRAPRGG